MEELVKLLTSKNLTISSCESLTAGLFAATLAQVSGASAVLQGGLITYQDEIKTRVAHVDCNVINTYGVISEECAKEMAQHTREIMNSDLCISFTGNSGPNTMENKPAGLVYCAIDGPIGVKCFRFQLFLERNELRKQVVGKMIQNVIQYIQMMY